MNSVRNLFSQIYDEEHQIIYNELKKMYEKSDIEFNESDFKANYLNNVIIFKKNFKLIMSRFSELLFDQKYNEISKNLMLDFSHNKG